MEGNTRTLHDPEKNEKEAPPKQPEATSLIGANWPSLPTPSESDSPIQPAQKEKSPEKTPWKIEERKPEDHEKNRVGKYAQYFKGNEILPIPEIIEKLEPRILSLVITDLKTRRLVGLKKEGFEDLLRKAGVPCQYFCRRSFATWDVLLPSKEQAAKAASTTITTKFFRLQPEYMGTRRVRVTVCNVPAFITGEVLAAFLSKFGRVEESNLLRSAAGTACGDHVFRICLDREGFQAIPEVIISRERQMMVVVEGRRPRCWSCKQLGHISKFCPQKNPANAAAATDTTATTTTTATITTAITSSKTPEKESGQVQPPKNPEEGWTEVTKKKKKSPKKTTTASPAKNADPDSPALSTTEPIPRDITEHTSIQTIKASSRRKAKVKTTPTTVPTTPEASETAMETAMNLKRRRNSEEGAAKKKCSGPPCPEDPLEGPSNAYPPKQSLHQQVPLHVPLLPHFPPLSLPPPPLPLPALPPPQYCIPQNATLEPLQPPQYLQPPQPPLPPPKPPQPPQPPQPIDQEHSKPPHHFRQLPKVRPHQILHVARSHSLERQPSPKFIRTLSLPSLSPSSSPELFPERIPTPVSIAADPLTTPSRQQAKAANSAVKDQCRKATELCSIETDSVRDHQLRKILKQLIQLEKVDKKKISNPLNFKSAAMVTTFIRSAGDRTKGVWQFLDTARQTDAGVKLAELEHSSLKRCLPFCSGRVPILVHPSFYRSLKVRFPLDVGGVSRDGRVNTELGTGSLRQAVGILTPEDFRPIVDTE